MPNLFDRLQGRDNNWNLLRMTAAMMVLFAHSFALVGQPEPWRATFGMTPGSVAVEVFFVISGLLLTHSMLARQSTLGFLQARALRIYPAFWVMLTLTVFVLGPAVTTLGLGEYLASKQTWRHFLKNVFAFTTIEYFLPGVFESNPAPRAVNGSIWTLRSELAAYGILTLAWIAAAAFKRTAWFKALCVLIFVVVTLKRITQLGTEPLEESHVRLYWAFFTGSAMCVLSRWVPLHGAFMAGAVGALVVGAFKPTWFPWLYSLTMPYVVVWLAYEPAGAVRQYNRLGDYSYGTYLYAFPLQQLLAWAVPGLSVAGMVVGSTLLTLLAAVLSWHGLEKRAMRWRVLPPAWTASQRKQAHAG